MKKYILLFLLILSLCGCVNRFYRLEVYALEGSEVTLKIDVNAITPENYKFDSTLDFPDANLLGN